MQPAFPALAGSDVLTGAPAEPIDIVVNGRPGTAMAAFGRLLSARDIAAALTYARNAFGNDTGDVIRPDQVETLLDPEPREELAARTAAE
jgi:cytochrome c oxidase subunit 2